MHLGSVRISKAVVNRGDEIITDAVCRNIKVRVGTFLVTVFGIEIRRIVVHRRDGCVPVVDVSVRLTFLKNFVTLDIAL